LFSQTAEYALRIVVFLAHVEGKPATNKQIAATTRVPEGYLAKIIQQLGRARLVESQRGLGGGAKLAKPATDITMYDVVAAVSSLPRIRECPLGLAAHGTKLCPVHRRLDDAMAHVEQIFKAATIAEMIAPKVGSIPLGNLPNDPELAARVAEAVFPVGRPTTLTIGGKDRKK